MAEAGGLLSYGPNIAERDRAAGVYVGRTVKAKSPPSCRCSKLNKFELIINVKTAKALNLNVPNSMQLLAHQVIE